MKDDEKQSRHGSVYGLQVIWVNNLYYNYSVHLVPTLKPGTLNHYSNDVYKDISNYAQRKVTYFDDKIRNKSMYMCDYRKQLNDEEYKKPRDQSLKIDLGKYEYSYDPNLVNMLTDKKCRDEAYVRDKL